MEKQTRLNQSVEKTLQIIEAMANAREPVRLGDLAREVDMPASTALRMVGTLVEHRYAYQDPVTLRYALTMKFAQIGAMVSARFSIRDIARPTLVELSRRCDESSCLAIEEDMEVIYLDVVDGLPRLLLLGLPDDGARGQDDRHHRLWAHRTGDGAGRPRFRHARAGL